MRKVTILYVCILVFAASGGDLQAQSWQVPLDAVSHTVVDTLSYFGINSSCTDGFDAACDVPEPPCPPSGDCIRIYFPHPEWGLIFTEFNSDIRAPIEEDGTKVWTFHVEVNHATTVDLSWPNLSQVPEDYTLLLTIHSDVDIINMRDSSHYSYSVPGGVTTTDTFEIIIENPPPPQCHIDPTSLDFDTVCIGQYSDMTFTIINTGGGTLSDTVRGGSVDYSLVGDSIYNLTAGQSDTFTVRFEPITSGPKNCTIETGNNLCSDVSCTGEGDEPECQVSPTTLDFETVCVGQYWDKQFTITNTGGCTLSGTVSATCADFSIFSSASYILGAGESDTFTVRFEPQSSGPKNCIIETGNDLCDDITCSGQGDEPECEVSPTTLDFETVCVGEYVEKTFTITNTGGCTLSDTVREGSVDYSLVGDSIYSLTAGQSDTFTVRFEPQSSGPKNCIIETGNDLCSDVSCSGEGDEPECQVSPTTLDFETVCVGEYVEKTFTITNIGGCTLSDTVRGGSVDYSLVGDSIYNLTAGQSDTFTVRFEPQSSGPKNCIIETGNDLCSDVSCSGEGDEPECQVSPTTLDFDTVCVGKYIEKTFTITNIGGCTLSDTVRGGSVDYSLVGDSIYNLTAGQSDTFTVRFEPQSSGLKNCTIETGSDLCSDISCSGKGEVSPSTPGNVLVTPGCNYISVSWEDIDNETGYLIYRNYSLLGSVVAGEATYVDFDPPVDSTDYNPPGDSCTRVHCYSISSFNICDTSDRSESVCDTLYQISGNVHDTLNNGIKDFTVYVKTPPEGLSLAIDNTLFDSTDSDSNGNYRFKLPRGKYRVYRNTAIYIIDLPINTEIWDKHGANFLVIDDSVTDVEDFVEGGDLPNRYFLCQNYPNPFNAKTNIEFSLAKNCHVKLIIYNILGRKIGKLLDQDLNAGLKSISWDGKDENGKEVSSGIYFYVIKSKTFTEIKKMLLLK